MFFEEAISKALSETNLEQQQMLDKATAEYFSSLPTREFPSTGDLDAAETRLRLFLRKELLTPAMLKKITGQPSFDNKSVESLKFAFDTIVPQVTVPKPAQLMELRAASVALAALLGAILGLALLTPLTRLALGMRDVGIVLGGPLGAFCLVLIVWRVSRSSSLIKFLQVSQRRPAFDQLSHEQVVRSCLNSWLNMAIPLLVALYCFSKSGQVFTDKEAAFSTLAGYIYALHSATEKDLPTAADELIQEARNFGFEGLEGQPQFFPDVEKREDSFVWASSLKDKYEAFGDINEGDAVKVERKPVILGGKVLKRGLVRKIRDRD
ncbi:MAG: hypothetical protein OEW48_00400 [Phycisphaerae bacterium]|nr:hypothetical protein [Phycisphaerae bacterium]